VGGEVETVDSELKQAEKGAQQAGISFDTKYSIALIEMAKKKGTQRKYLEKTVELLHQGQVSGAHHQISLAKIAAGKAGIPYDQERADLWLKKASEFSELAGLMKQEIEKYELKPIQAVAMPELSPDQKYYMQNQFFYIEEDVAKLAELKGLPFDKKITFSLQKRLARRYLSHFTRGIREILTKKNAPEDLGQFD
jgi:hypothetical protein